MKYSLTLGSYRYFWSQLASLMMSLYLLTDMLSGFSIIYLGVDIKASFIYKMPLFILILFLIASFNCTLFCQLLALILLMFIGPFFQFYLHGKLEYFIFDFSSAIKILTPIFIFFLYREWYKYTPDLALKSTHTILKYGFIILSFNFIIGMLGFGKSTYVTGEDGGIGTTGLIMAGNEVGGVFVVAFGYMLHYFWNKKSKKEYILLALFTIFCGVSITTKTAIFAAFLVVFFIPIVNERHRLYKMTLLKLQMFTPLLVITVAAIILILEILHSLGLYDRVMHAYNQTDILTTLLSGRNLYVRDSLGLVVNSSGLFEQVFGQGIALSFNTVKAGISEVDSVDTYISFGLVTLLFVVSFYVFLLYKAHQQTVEGKCFFSPFVLLASFILLLLSQLSGHIWASGTIGILMGVMLGSLNARNSFT